jgi:large subunit ribosomal protein L23
MNREELMTVLIAPHVTEKSSLAMQNHNQYTFRVRRDATKVDVKKAVQLMFYVQVRAVDLDDRAGAGGCRLVFDQAHAFALAS